MASAAVGHPAVLAAATTGVLAWVGVGVGLSFPTKWLLTTNVAGTIAILLFLLVIRHSQHMHMRSIHAKLDELIRAGDGGNHVIGSEKLADDMLEELRVKHKALAAGNRD